jgi:hypothetical protein
MLVKLLDDMFNDKETNTYIVITPNGVFDCEYLRRKTKDLLDVLGVKHRIDGFSIQYEHRWNGELQFVRTIRFTTEDSYKDYESKWTRAKLCKVFNNN